MTFWRIYRCRSTLCISTGFRQTSEVVPGRHAKALGFPYGGWVGHPLVEYRRPAGRLYWDGYPVWGSLWTPVTVGRKAYP